MSDERFIAIEGRLDTLEVKVDRLEVKVDALDRRFDQVDRRFDDLDRRMHVLHEDTIANIRALAPDPEEFTRNFTAADDKLRQDIARRLDPLEAFAKTRGFEAR